MRYFLQRIEEYLSRIVREGVRSMEAEVSELTRTVEKLQSDIDNLEALHLQDAIEKFLRTCRDDRSLLKFIEDNSSDRGSQYLLALRRMGVLNYENPVLSGEKSFVKKFFAKYGPSVVFDVGANTGRFSELILDAEPASRVFAFEPSHGACKKLRENFGSVLNIFEIGLGSRAGTAQLNDYVGADGSEHGSVVEGVIQGLHRGKQTRHKIEISTVDRIVSEHNIENINLLKIDTEGYEFEVIQGAQDSIRDKKVAIILFEFNAMNVFSRVFMKDFYDNLDDYNFFRLLPNSAIFFREYDPVTMEVFAFQNYVAIRKDLDYHWIF